MKRKQILYSLTLTVAVLFSILFQSIHSYEHIVKQLSEKQCHHNYNDPSGEITHQHHDYDVCLVCHFSFEYSKLQQIFQIGNIRNDEVGSGNVEKRLLHDPCLNVLQLFVFLLQQVINGIINCYVWQHTSSLFNSRKHMVDMEKRDHYTDMRLR